MRVTLRVPFAEKDKAKALGARWDAGRKTWYVPDGVDAMKFVRWLPTEWAEAKAKLDKAPRSAIAGKEMMGSAYQPSGCDCDIPPWEPCPHSFPWPRDATYDPANEYREHMAREG